MAHYALTDAIDNICSGAGLNGDSSPTECLPWRGTHDCFAHDTCSLDVTIYASGNATALTVAHAAARFRDALGETLFSDGLQQRIVERASPVSRHMVQPHTSLHS